MNSKMISQARHLQTKVHQKHQSKSQCQVRFDFQTNWTLWQPQHSLNTASASAVTSNAPLKSSFKLQMHKLAGLPRVLTFLLQQLMLLPLCLAPLNLSVIIENCIPYWQWGDTFIPLWFWNWNSLSGFSSKLSKYFGEKADINCHFLQAFLLIFVNKS